MNRDLRTISHKNLSSMGMEGTQIVGFSACVYLPDSHCVENRLPQGGAFYTITGLLPQSNCWGNCLFLPLFSGAQIDLWPSL